MKVKEELSKLLSEALYLGITPEDLKQMIADIEASVGGNQSDDRD